MLRICIFFVIHLIAFIITRFTRSIVTQMKATIHGGTLKTPITIPFHLNHHSNLYNVKALILSNFEINNITPLILALTLILENFVDYHNNSHMLLHRNAAPSKVRRLYYVLYLYVMIYSQRQKPLPSCVLLRHTFEIGYTRCARSLKYFCVQTQCMQSSGFILYGPYYIRIRDRSRLICG